MASSTTIDVDDNFEDVDTRDGGMDTLNFQDIPHGSPSASNDKNTHEFTNFPHSAVDSDDEESDTAKLIKEEKKGSSSFWTFAYYQQFFDVETTQVGQRIVGSMVPRPGTNYLVTQIRPNPDLYGPFWICTTLVFTTAIAGNLANYFSVAGKDYHWQYDFHKVTFAASAIFSYWWIIPLLLFGVFWWRGSQAKFSFLEMLCVYGYSLAIYIPISILWTIQVSWLQWLLVIVGASLSGSVLLFTFWPAIKEDNRKIAIGLMCFILIMHATLAAGFVLYFFHVPSSSSAPGTPPVPIIPTNGTAKTLMQNQAKPGAQTKVEQTPQAGRQAEVLAGNNEKKLDSSQTKAAGEVSQNLPKIPKSNLRKSAGSSKPEGASGETAQQNVAKEGNGDPRTAEQLRRSQLLAQTETAKETKNSQDVSP